MIFQARVKELKKLNEGVFELILVHDNDLFYFNAGQYIWIETKYGRRAFSISSSSSNFKELKILFKAGIESDYMRYLSILKIGDAVNLIGPRGVMRIPDENSKSIYIAGGVGITPFLSIVRTLKDKGVSRNITLISVNKNKEFEIYKDEIAEITKKDKNIKSLFLTGKIKYEDLVDISGSNKYSDWYVVGSQNFVDGVFEILEKLKIPQDKIFFEENFPSVSNIDIDSTNNDFFRKVTDQSAIHIVVTDSNGIIKYVNKSAEKMTGYKAEEMIGNTPRLWGGLMDKQTYEDFWRTIKVEKRVYIGELQNIRANGEKYDVLATVSPIIEGEKLVGFIGMEQDITEDKKTKNELKKIRDLMIDRVLERDKKL
jgi:PAS domain S-box-containing protein